MSPTTEKIDNLIHLQTPEGVELTLAPAGLVPRAIAWLIDLLIRIIILFVVAIIFSMMGNMGTAFYYLAFFLIEWMYPVYYEIRKDGSTPGKKSMGIMTVQDDGTPVGMSASFLRNLLRTVDFLPFFYALGLVSCAIRKDGKRLGDLVAGTLVIYRWDAHQAEEIPEGESLMPALPLAIDEQREIVAFAERYHKFSDERKLELSSILSPELINDPQNAIEDTVAMARWIKGL